MEKAFKAAHPDANIIINENKPRKGSFVVTVFSPQDDTGTKIIELLDMPRPFKKLKELNLEKLVEDFLAEKK